MPLVSLEPDAKEMAKQQWSFMSFNNHIHPQKDEQLKRLKLAVDDQVDMILKITSDINHGNKERNLRKKSEAIELILDFHQQYEKLYILYENLREKVKESVDGGEDNTSSSAESEELNGAKIKQLEAEIQILKAEVSTLCTDKRRLEEEVEWKSNEAMETQDKISRLQAQLMEMEAASNEQERLFTSRISDLEAQAQQMHLEMKSLKHERDELLDETKQYSSQLQKKSDDLLQIEALTSEKESLQVKVYDLESEVESLRNTKNDLEEQANKMNHEVSESSAEKEKLQEEISELKKAIDQKENELSTVENKFKDYQTMMSAKMKALEEAVVKEKEQSSLIKSHLEKVTRTNLHNVERKIEEMAVEFRKQFEDQYRLLSRRIRVAEQLHAENKEWYRKTRDGYEQGNKDYKARTATELKNMKGLTLAANDFLTTIDSNTIKFEECTAKFMKKISKASGEINLAKHCAMKKNRAASDMKGEMECLVSQLEDKEAEISASKEKVCELEDKVGELKKIIDEKDDEVILLTEEKREAIRQLCVGIDYQRDLSNSYKKLLSDMSTARRRAS